MDFSTGRLFFAWRPIRVSPLQIPRFFDRAGEILPAELLFDAAAAAAGTFAFLLRSRRKTARLAP